MQDYSPSSTAASSDADDDRPRAVVLSGPVGAGKTALVYAAAQVRLCCCLDWQAMPACGCWCQDFETSHNIMDYVSLLQQNGYLEFNLSRAQFS